MSMIEACARAGYEATQPRPAGRWDALTQDQQDRYKDFADAVLQESQHGSADETPIEEYIEACIDAGLKTMSPGSRRPSKNAQVRHLAQMIVRAVLAEARSRQWSDGDGR